MNIVFHELLLVTINRVQLRRKHKKKMCNTMHDLPTISAELADESFAQLTNCGDQQGSERRFCSFKSFALRVEFL
jgi:hypothetical protein